MYDDPVSVFVKARDGLVLSILDGKEVENSVEEYIFAKANLTSHGFQYDVTWKERICDSLITKAFGDNELMPKGEWLKQIAEAAKGHLSSLMPWRNRAKSAVSMSSEESILSPEEQRKIIADRVALSHAHDIEMSEEMGRPFGSSSDHPFHPLYDPSKSMDSITGLQRRHKRMIEQVLPLATNHQTHAKTMADIERAQDEYLRKEGSLHHTGMKFDDGHMFHGLGPLSGLKGTTVTTMEDAYDRDFERWLSGDQDWRSINDEGNLDADGSWRNNAIADVKSRGLSTDIPEGHHHSEEELALRKLHAEDRGRSWSSKVFETDTKEKSGTDIYADWEKAGEGALLDDKTDHGHYLGDTAVMHQLQWFSPRERSAIMRAIHDGLDKANNQDIKLPDGSTVSAGRIKRQTHQMLGNLLHRGGRYAGFTSANAIPSPRESNDQMSDFDQDKLFDSLHDIIEEEGLSEDTINNMREALGLEVYNHEGEEDEEGYEHHGKHFDEEGKFHREIKGLPKFSVEDLMGKDPETGEDMPLSKTEAIAKIIRSGETDARLSKTEIMTALGFDPKTGAPMEAGSHPFYPNHNGPIISETDMASLLDRAKSNNKIAIQAKEMRNQMLLHGGSYFFREDQMSEAERKMMEKMGLGDGNFHGLGAFFAPLFWGSGLSRNPHTLPEIIHDSLSYTDPETGMSTSIMGSKDGEKFTVNRNNIGLFGPYFGHRYDIFNTPHAAISNFNNSKDPSGQTALNPKNQTLAHISSLAPGLINMLANMSDAELKSTFGPQLFDLLKPSITSRGHSVKTPHGKTNVYILNRGKKAVDVAAAGAAAEVGKDVAVPDEFENEDTEKIREKTERDRVHQDQAIMAYSIATHLGLGDTGRPQSPVEIKPEYLIKRPAAFGARVGEITDPEGMLDFFALHDKDLTPDNLKGAKRNRAAQHVHDLNSRIPSHMAAITRMASALAQLKPEGTFSPENPNLATEIDFLFKDANRALMMLPRGASFELPDGSTFVNNFTVYEYGIDKEQTPIKQTGFTDLPSHMMEHGTPVTSETTLEEFMNALGYTNDGKHRAHAASMLEQIKSQLGNEGDSRVVMSMHDIMTSGAPIKARGREANLFDDYNELEDVYSHLDRVLSSNQAKTADNRRMTPDEMMENFGYADATQKMNEIAQHVRTFDSYLRTHENTKVLPSLGIQRIGAPESMRMTFFGKDKKKKRLFSDLFDFPSHISLSGKGDKANFNRSADLVRHRMRDILVHDPNTDLEKVQPLAENQSIRFGPGREIHPVGHEGVPIMDLYSNAMALKFANPALNKGKPESRFEFDTGTPNLGNFTTEEAVVPVDLKTITSVFDADVAAAVVAQDEARLDPQGIANAYAPQFAGGPSYAEDPVTLTQSEPGDYAAFLLNPDSILMKGDSPSWIPPIRPMHRIFSFKDLQRLRGFTGSWVVSKWYNGERIAVIRKGNRVTAYDESGRRRSIPEWARKGIKNLGEKDCTLDCILREDEMNVIDIMFYDDTDITDMSVQERLKILRGQYDSYEQVIIPGPHDTKLTDEDGLEDLINDFLDEHKTLLLRDGKSTYMKGERRHPKWVLLRPNKTINLKVLDKRGKKPFTYRLGAGPLIDDVGIEERTIEQDGDVYLDVGTVSSPKPFEEGDIVEVKVSGIKHQEKEGRDVYTMTPIKIVGEGEGESSVSMETLGMLSKSYGHLHFPHDVDVKDDTVTVYTPDGNQVFYTLAKADGGYWVHSPKTVLSDMGEDYYSIMLSESLKPFWGQVASMLLKGKIERVNNPIPSEEAQEEIEEESKHLNDDIVTKPALGKALGVIERVLDILEKNEMGFGGGSRGYGIDLGALTESPRGPTHLEGEETLPDYDMRARPTEDAEKPYPRKKRHQKRDDGLQYSDSNEKEEVKAE